LARLERLEPRTLLSSTPIGAGHASALSALMVGDAAVTGPSMLKDVNACDASSSPTELTQLGNIVYFFADDGIHGKELWRTDGTAGGTYMVIDTIPGSSGLGDGAPLTTDGTSLYYVYRNAPVGDQIWTSDGTAGGTHLYDSGMVCTEAFNAIGGVVYFVGQQAYYNFNVQVWECFSSSINPTPWAISHNPSGGYWPGHATKAAGMMWWSEFHSYYSDYIAATNNATFGQCLEPAGFTDVNGHCMFTASGGVWLYVSNSPVEAPGPGSPNGTLSAVFANGKYFFNASDAAHGTELWTWDGNSGDAASVVDINPGTADSSPQSLTTVGNEVYFLANDGTHGTELWKSDGTTAGTAMVADLTPGAGGSTIANLTAVGNTLFFTFNDGTHGTELWKSDGTSAGTMMVADISPGIASSSPGNLTNYSGVLLFTADDGVHGQELWRSDGTAAGTSMVLDINTNTLDSNPSGYVAVGAMTYFVANDGVHGQELWKTDGTTAGTALVADINPGAGGSYPAGLANVGGTLFFSANDGTDGTELWKSDGTAAGTVMVSDINPGAGGSYPSDLTNVGGTLFFAANDGTDGTELWKSDGTPGGTVLVKDIRSGSADSSPQQLTNVSGTLFFVANDGSTGNEVWRSNGTTQGTTILKDIRSGGQTSYPSGLCNAGGTLYFSADDGIHGAELWASNGTTASTTLVKDIRSGSAGSSPAMLTPMGSKVFFTANDGTTGTELWVSDGTAGGTFLVDDLNGGSGGSSFGSLAATGSELFFTANGHLLETNGTAGNVTTLASVSPTTGLAVAGGRVFFGNNDGTDGPELWQSDGTSSGTSLVADLFPGPSGSSPTALMGVGDRLFFTATDQFLGTEPWMLAVSPTVTINQAAAQSDPTPSPPIDFTAVFSVPMTDFTGQDVSFAGSTAPGTLVAVVTGSGTTYSVAVSGMTGPGTVVASIPAGVAHDVYGMANVASTSTDNTVTFNPPPFTVTIDQTDGQPNPARTMPIDFTAVFSQPATDFTGQDVSFAGSTAPGTLVAVVTGSGTTYSVAVSGMTDCGTVEVSIPAGLVHDIYGTANAASLSSYNTITYIAPLTVTINQATNQSDPTNQAPIHFTAVFAQAVYGFDAGGISLSGTAAGKSVVDVEPIQGSNTTYDVQVTATGSGTVVATVQPNACSDSTGTPSEASTSTDNSVLLDIDPPTAALADPPASGTIQDQVLNTRHYLDITYSDTGGSGLDTSTVLDSAPAFTLGGTAAAGVVLDPVPTLVSGGTYRYAFTGSFGAGPVSVNFPANAFEDAAGNASAAANFSFNVQPTVSIGNVTLKDGTSGTTKFPLVVTLSSASPQKVTVLYATANGTAVAPGDYTAAAGTLTILPGQTQATVTVLVRGNKPYQTDKNFSVNLSGASGAVIGTATGAATIQSGVAPPKISIGSVSHKEGNSGTTPFTFTVSLSAASGAPATVAYATADGTATTADGDYTATNGTLTFQPGQTKQTVTVAVSGDTKYEASETFTVNLSGPVNATIAAGKGAGKGAGTGTIQNDDKPPVVTIGNPSVVESPSGGMAAFVVTLSPASGLPATVKYTTVSGTAKAGVDFTATSGTLTFTAGQTSQTINVPILSDPALRSAETFQVKLSGAAQATLGSKKTGTGTIQPASGLWQAAAGSVDSASKKDRSARGEAVDAAILLMLTAGR
jgi:ELWxxDGT repeat protein